MGAADIVPGVSGGTIALIAGIYERLINALSSIGPNLWQIFRQEKSLKLITDLFTLIRNMLNFWKMMTMMKVSQSKGHFN